MLFNSSTITAPFLLHHCLKAKTLVKLEMLVVSEQLQYLDQMTVWWVRVGKAGEENHNDCIFKQKREFCDVELLLYTGFQVLHEEGVTLHQALVLAQLLRT